MQRGESRVTGLGSSLTIGPQEEAELELEH